MKHNSTLSYYEKHSLELTERYENADVDDLHKRLLKTFTGCSSILDIGCGSGREAAFLVRNGFDVLCVDGSAEMVKHAEQAHPELKGKIEQRIMPEDFPADTAFDGVCAVAFFMHLTLNDLKKVLEKIFLVLKPMGRLFFSVPLSRPHLQKSGTDPSGRYFLILSRHKWEKTVADSGFIILETFTNRDGLGRKNITWFTCTAQKPA